VHIAHSFNKKARRKIIRYMQILFVVLAFGLMVIVSYWFVSDIERKHLQRDVKNAILNTAASIIADLKEPETILAGFAETLRGMIIRGDTVETVREYIHYINKYMQDNEKDRLLGIMGFYGFFDVFGKVYFTEGADWIPPEGYELQDRPWYIAAVEANGDIGITEPYINLRTGGTPVITFSRCIFDEDGKVLGIVCLDIKLDRVSQHAVDTQFAEKGYGFLLSKNMDLIAHPEPSIVGMAFRDVKSHISSYADELIQKGHVDEVITTDYRNIECIVFLERLQNGWYMGVVTPRDEYYQTTRNMALFLTILGVILATVLIAVLLVLFRQMNIENKKSQSMAYWYNSILNAIPLPISVTDADKNWTFINTAVEKFLSITLENAIGKPCSNWGAEICKTEDCGVACARRGLKQTYFTEGDLSYQIDTAILKDMSDKTMGYIEVMQDITNMKTMAKKQADAEAANAAKSAFLAKVSHEIRTPMNAILGITEIQLQDETLSQDMQEALSRIYNSGYLLLGLINDILDLSKIEAGKLELTPVNYDVPSLINDTVHLNIMRFDSKPIVFDLHLEENIPLTLMGDELRIKQILNNLLSNAFKYTDSGKVSLSIAVEPSDKPSMITLLFRVSDTGQGMTREQLDKLFDEYTRFNLEANRATEGAGLGMNITRRLVELMNGEILVESVYGKGSLFTVRLPQGIVDDGVLGKAAVENLMQFRLGRMSQMKKAPQVVREYMPYGKVLIVDDVETNLYVAKGLMAPYGLTIDTAMSGFESIEKIKRGAVYDIIFMDHFMPKMDGIEAAKIIRGLGYTQPIVALTANALTGQTEVFMANGFDGFISKPIDIHQLNAVLNKLVRDKYPEETVEAARQNNNNMKRDVVSNQPANAELIKIFTRDAEKAFAVLGTICEKRSDYGDEDIQSYIVNVHAMKSALANIGEEKLSAFASKLEEAGRERDITRISEETPEFLSALRTVIEKNKLTKDGNEDADNISHDDMVYLSEKLTEIKKACAEHDKKTAKDTLSHLREKKWPQPVAELLEKMAEHLLHSEFAESAKIAEDYINNGRIDS
jgi:signal transduction histidine kinase/CheY-like chemotaxis protein/HPt (histidine-containing phosphotransfer) domain-containing protein